MAAPLNSEERNGYKFTAAQRQKMRAKAWELREGGMPQLQIAHTLDVSQATISNWLRRYARDFPQGTPQQKAADKIRQELVCCDIFEQGEAVKGDLEALQRLREGKGWHAICYYGEWAARIAEKVI